MTAIAKTQQRTDLLMIGISYFGFIILGIPGALLGVAWSPYIQDTFGLPLDAVAVLLIASTTGYTFSSFMSGRLVARFGMGRLLMYSTLVGMLALIGYVFVPSWPLLIGLALMLGSGGGVIDSGLNIYFAAHYSPRLMNWLHASFGVGATLGPLIMTAAVSRAGVVQWGPDVGTLALVVNVAPSQSWRLGYAITASIFGIFLVCLWFTRDWWHTPESTNENGDTPRQRSGNTLLLPAVWMSVALFFLYGGVEIIPGQWSFALFTQSRGITPEAAGLWVSLYWATFTVGRVIFGFIVGQFNAGKLLNMCFAGMVAGAFLYWTNFTPVLGFVGLGIVGFAVAPIFPLAISLTPERLGKEHAGNAIGFQVGGASLGIALLPGLAGVLANNMGIEIVGFLLFVLAVIVGILYVVSGRIGARSTP